MSSLGFKSEVQQAMVIGHIGFPPQGGSHGRPVSRNFSWLMIDTVQGKLSLTIFDVRASHALGKRPQHKLLLFSCNPLSAWRRLFHARRISCHCQRSWDGKAPCGTLRDESRPPLGQCGKCSCVIFPNDGIPLPIANT